jgi:hypothetical protein
MLKEAAADGGLLMRLPHIEEVAHKPGDILPALDILGTALTVKGEGLLIKSAVVARFAQMITRLAGEPGQGLSQRLLFGVDADNILVAEQKPLAQLGGEHFEFGLQNMGA